MSKKIIDSSFAQNIAAYVLSFIPPEENQDFYESVVQ